MSLARLVRLPLLAAIVIASATAFADPPPTAEGGPEAGPRPGRREGGPGKGQRGEGRPGGGPRGQGGPGGGPSPERFIEHAFSFDADGDGKLDRTEFESFAKDFHERRRGGPGGGGPGGPGGAGGERPQRPPRPE
jgi:translation initiation factor IF-2